MSGAAKPRRRRTVLQIVGGLLVVLTIDAAAAPPQRPSTVDALVATCPSSAERAALRSDFSVRFERDSTLGTRVCGTTRLQERAFQALRVIKAMRFARPLPWTRASLYDWLNGAVRGVRFRGDIDTSFCCQPSGVVNVQAQFLDAIDVGDTASLLSLAVEVVHEARHAEGPQHTCRALDDQSLGEHGAWYVESMLQLWIGLYGSPFIARYRASALAEAQAAFARICELPHADVSVTATRRSIVVRNAGGVALAKTWLAADLPVGAALDRGACLRVTTTRVACELGTLAAESRRVLPLHGAGRGVLRATVVATSVDERPANNVARVSLR